MLRHFQDQGLAAPLGMQGVQDFRQLAFELNVHDGAQHLRNLADVILGHR